jgi:hypothetical protein
MAIQVNGTTVIDNSRVLSNVTGLKTVNSTSILGSGDITAGGNIASDFTVTAFAGTFGGTLTTTGGAGTYALVCWVKGDNSNFGSITLSSYTNVDDGWFSGNFYDNGTVQTGYSPSNRSNSVQIPVYGLLTTSGNFTISGSGSERWLSWAKLA